MKAIGLICLSLAFVLVGNAQKETPPISPPPKKILFTNQLYGNTEVNEMLEIADELRERGHKTEFFLIPQFEDKIKARGHAFQSFPDPLAESGDGLIEATVALHNAPDWFKYVSSFDFFTKVLATGYEPSLIALRERIEQDKPDLIVASMFADHAIDLAASFYNIPLAIMYACPLGGYLVYEDHPSTPDALLWDRFGEHLSMWRRFRKFLRLGTLIVGTTEAGSIVNQAREKHGIPTYADPLTNWGRAAIIVPVSWELDVARRIRPLTYVVGLISSPFDTTKELSPTDKKLSNYIGSKSGGIVFCALGSLGTLDQDGFDELVQGMAEWVKLGSKRGAVYALNPNGQEKLDTSQVPSSVRIEGWVNQKMVLNHRNTKVFVTHGGLGSLSEGIISQTPMLVLPMFGDQMSNALRLEEAGVALGIHFREEPIVASSVTTKLESLATDLAFVSNLKRLYQISAREGGAHKAADVIEDMLLLGNLDHLVPSEEKVSFFEKNNFDIFVLFLVFMGSILYAVVKGIVMCTKKGVSAKKEKVP